MTSRRKKWNEIKPKKKVEAEVRAIAATVVASMIYKSNLTLDNNPQSSFERAQNNFVQKKNVT